MTEGTESLRNSADSTADLCLRQSRMNSRPSQVNVIYSPGLCLITPAQAKVVPTSVAAEQQTCLLLALLRKREPWFYLAGNLVYCIEEFGKKKECFWKVEHYKTDFTYNERERLQHPGKGLSCMYQAALFAQQQHG